MARDGGSVSALGSVSFGWLHEHGGFTFDEPYFLDPEVRLEREQRIHAFVAQRFPDVPIYNIEAHLVQVEGRRQPVALVGALQPNLILGAAVGAKFVFADDKDPDITPTPLADLTDPESLERIDWVRTWPIDLLLEQVHRMRETHGRTHQIIPPFFWDTTGRATIHGILTTAQKLVGQRIFMHLLDAPGFVRDLFEWITDAYISLIRMFAQAADIEVTGLHIGDCSLCMVGPEQFTEFVLPRVNKLARRFGAVRFHSCGNVDHLLPAFQPIENMTILNVGSGTSVAKIRALFSRIRIDLTPDLRMITYGSPADVDAWVRRTLEENDGGPLEIQDHLDVAQPEANCLQIFRTLAELGIPCRRESIY